MRQHANLIKYEEQDNRAALVKDPLEENLSM